MKARYLPVFIIFVFIWFGAAADSIVRVKAVGLAPPGIHPESRARAFALRAAKVEGYIKLARTAGWHIQGKTFLIKGARVVHKRYISDYKVEVVMEIKKIDLYHSGISRLKREIKTIEAQMSTLKRRLEKLKKIVASLEEKVKKKDNPDEG